jgi:hypothetical protein
MVFRRPAVGATRNWSAPTIIELGYDVFADREITVGVMVRETFAKSTEDLRDGVALPQSAICSCSAIIRNTTSSMVRGSDPSFSCTKRVQPTTAQVTVLVGAHVHPAETEQLSGGGEG